MVPITVTPTSKKFLSGLPKGLDYTQITIPMLRAARDPAELDESIPRPKVTVEKIEIPANDGHAIDVEIYRPANIEKDEILPALVYLPGGGFCLAAQGAHPFLVTKLAGEIRAAVFLVNYSLAPENKYPVALEECYSVVAHVTSAEHAAKYKVDPTRVALGGDSAGGNLTITTLLLAQERKLENSIKYQVLYYPATGGSLDNESHKLFGDEYYLTSDLTALFLNSYIRDEEDLKSKYVYPLPNTTVEELVGLPPALLIVGEVDVLRYEGEAWAHKLREANVPVTSFRIQGCIHGFMSIPLQHSEETLQSIDITVGALRRVFYQS
ncbi:unnamed protein product [Mucor hiemalis]